MGLIDGILGAVFGGGRNVLVDTAEVFRVNREAESKRAFQMHAAAMASHSAEFTRGGKGWFDGFMDGLNRIPRPAMALGTLGLFGAAMVDPVWFASRMQGIALVPEPLWWLLGAIVSFYFGARHQAKGQEFQRSIADTVARTPAVVENIGALDRLRSDVVGVAETGPDAVLEKTATKSGENPALEAWKQSLT
ncbi:holin family protein [Poseidonocella sedimentorum]|uniref:Holin of 3TMs, for gene-transfer release n=1 Tax=Poseidonocella sedimentorum TaxID=871652 RepID=A0A1I6CRP1_9RHOB|nr:holin family protein [Poseidonocella sedimentorum]SFQ95856.1 Holin of 3TMs, for gene-transfer release [Poseidonocella sedimentorum]